MGYTQVIGDIVWTVTTQSVADVIRMCTNAVLQVQVYRRAATTMRGVTQRMTLISHASLWAGASFFHMMSQRYRQAESIASFHGPIPTTPAVDVWDRMHQIHNEQM